VRVAVVIFQPHESLAEARHASTWGWRPCSSRWPFRFAAAAVDDVEIEVRDVVGWPD
jgi:hypothetical protein